MDSRKEERAQERANMERGQFMKIKPGTSEEERTVFLRNSDRKTDHLLERTSVKVVL